MTSKKNFSPETGGAESMVKAASTKVQKARMAARQAAEEQDSNAPERCPLVVGIGASSGGHEALEHLFTAMPTDCGLSFVVIMHFHPAGPSFLPDILGRCTTMPVMEAEDGASPRPNTVQIIPPGKYLTISSGRFHLEEPKQAWGHHPIDRFFRTLAANVGEHALAVVLSGAGTDGAAGVTEVRAAGGAVLVQEPDSAISPGMPRSAIATGAADFVLPAEEIAAKIAAIARGTCVLTGRECHVTTLEEELHTIFSIVKAGTGHDFSSYKTNTVMRRIERRMTINAMSGIGKYIALLKESPREAQALCQDILIGVTSFFRDPEAFALLRREIIPRLFTGRDPEEPVRIWHACCATGEEVYSMAILIREYLNEQRLIAKVQFFATDIDETAIDQARAGLYGGDIKAEIGEERFQAFFTRDDGRWRVAKSLREMIVFAHHNLIKDPPFSRLDLLVCRNFLIYLNPAMQKRLIPLFHQVLKPGGFLFLGSAETVGRHSDLFAPVDKKWKIFERLESGRRAEMLFPFAAPIRRPPGTGRPPRPDEAPEAGPGEAAEKLLMERYSPSCVVVNEKYEVVHVSTRANRFLEVPVGEPTRDILKMAREELRPALRAAIYKAFAEQRHMAFQGVTVDIGGQKATVNVLVEPLPPSPSAGKLAMVVFEPVASAEALPVTTGEEDALAGSDASREILIRQLEEQLRITHEQLQAVTDQLETSHEGFLSTNEELMSINEEYQSGNEELQSTNEELETSKEELQVLNEELVTVNAELQGKVEELNQANSDMENLLASSEIATIFLDRNLAIKRFSPAMAVLFNLMPSDNGRPFRHFAGKIDWSTFTRDAETVLSGQPFAEQEVATLGGERCYLKRIFPYRKPGVGIDGIVVTFIDITERKQMEDALKESEQRVRLKLENILSPEGDISNLELADIIDAPSLQALMDDFYQLTRMPMGLLDIKGKVLVGVGWQEVCTKFHRVNPETCRNCVESDVRLSAGVPHGEYKIYKCKNNMWDVATPVLVGDRQFGNLFMGQFFFEDEPLDYELFRSQARQYGFDEKGYIAALEAVPRLSREALNTSMSFFMKLADILSKLSYSNLKLARSLSERDTLMESLRESEERFRSMFERHNAVMLLIEPESGAIVDANAAATEFYGHSRETLRGLNIQDLNQMPPEEVAAERRRAAEEQRSHFVFPHRIAAGEVRWVEVYSTPVAAQGKPLLFSIIHDITERRRAEEEREINVEFLRLVNESRGTEDLVRAATTFFQDRSGCEAVGIRLHEREDYPYYEARGFPEEFIQAENRLCEYDVRGDVVRDMCGNPVTDCMCGNVICGRFDPSKPFFTAKGSFWTNCTTELLASTSEADRQARTRNRCNGEGYESVALIPLRLGEDRLGLLQLNDRRKGRFSPETIALWERLTDYLSVALAKFRADEALHESQKQNEFLANLLEVASQPFSVGYPDGRLGLFNNAFERLTGYTGDELRSIDWNETLTPSEWRENEREKLGELLRTCRPVRYEKEYLRKDGSRIPIELLVHLVVDADGKPLYYYAFVTDITERRRAEEEIRQRVEELRFSNKELSRFNSASVGRELRMIELKKEINDLCGQAGQQPRYPLDFEKEEA